MEKTDLLEMATVREFNSGLLTLNQELFLLQHDEC